MKLARRVFLDLVGVIVFISLFGTIVGALLLSRALRAEAFGRVRNDLRAARQVLDDQLLHLSLAAELVVAGVDASGAKGFTGGVKLPTEPDLLLLFARGRTGLDPLRTYLTEEAGVSFTEGERGFLVIPLSMLESAGFDAGKIPEKSVCDDGSTFWLYAVAAGSAEGGRRADPTGDFAGGAGAGGPAGYGSATGGFAGVLLNGNEELIFDIQGILFGEGMYGKKPFGTVTIFCGDRRVATTVVGPTGEIALGTSVSEVVRKAVLEEGRVWLDRAFVVDDWYLSAYEPIRDRNGENAGILYVGVLEKKYLDIQRRAVLYLSAITLPALGLLLFGVFYLSKRIVKPVAMLADASKKIEAGTFEAAVPADGRIDEIRTLTRSFESMAGAINKRESMLREANLELEEANRNYQELLSFVTHELNNSIGSLLLNVSILNDGTVGELDTEQREVSELIQRDVERFRDMVRNYLNISRLEKGTLKFRPERVDIRRNVVEPVLNRLEKRLTHKGMNIRWSWGGEAVVQADAELMDICFSNLLINAIKYGSGWVELSARKADGSWVFGVRNGGPAIPADKIGLLFRKYSRLVKSDDGAGLGLFLVRQIAERHGGEVWCESGVETGTGFFIKMPGDPSWER